MMFTKVRGQFKDWTIALEYDAAAPSKTSVEAVVDVASIDTRDAQRDAYLRSSDFFRAEKFPKMTFRSKSVEPMGRGRYRLVGELTIRDATRELRLDVEQTDGEMGPSGVGPRGFTAKAALSRSDWGLEWNPALEAGGVLVSDKVEIEVEIRLVPVTG